MAKEPPVSGRAVVCSISPLVRVFHACSNDFEAV